MDLDFSSKPKGPASKPTRSSQASSRKRGVGTSRIISTKSARSQFESTSLIPRAFDPTKKKNVNRREKVIGDDFAERLKRENAVRETPEAHRQMIENINNLRSSLPILHHYQISIGLHSYDEIQKLGKVSITSSDENSDAGTVKDTRMGSLTPESPCDHCKIPGTHCPIGHFGRIEFTKPIFHPNFMNNRNKTIIKILQCFCRSCGSMLLSKERLKAMDIKSVRVSERLNVIYNKSINLSCPNSDKMIKDEETGLEVPDPRYKRCNGKVKYVSGESGKKGMAIPKASITGLIPYIQKIGYGSDAIEQVCTMEPEEALIIFKSISDEDAKILGFKGNIFDRYILRSMLVPPNNTRNANIIDGRPNANDITTRLNSIVIANNSLHDAITELNKSRREALTVGKGKGGIGRGYTNSDTKDKKVRLSAKGKSSVQERYHALFERVTEYFEYITTLLQGKTGLIRNIMTGKRGGFSGRAVLSPCDSIELGEVAIPIKMVTKLTPSYVITESNIKEMSRYLAEGKITTITKNAGPDAGETYSVVNDRKHMYNLEYGDKVQRWLMDGDFVVIDRQPSLHKQNMFACRAKIWNNSTIGVHLALTPGTNADFDGDEMSVWVVDEEEMEEIFQNLYVPRNVISSQNSKPIVAAVMDSLASTYLMTQDDVYIPPYLMGQAMTIVSSPSEMRTLKNIQDDKFIESPVYSLHERLKMHGIPDLSGKAMFSTILPENFTYEKGGVEIKNGVLVRGVIGKDTVGTTARSLVQDINYFYGSDRVQKFITDLTRVARIFLDYHGLSPGLEDCTLAFDPRVEKLIREKLEDAELKRLVLGNVTKTKEDMEEMNMKINDILDGLKNIGTDIMELMDNDNAFVIMAKSGAKGSKDNTMQILAAVGQQYYNGKRVERKLANGTRTSSHIRQDDFTLKAEGLCVHGFHRGLTPTEMYYHFRGGREGLSATATTTSKIGELQRKTGKNTEDTISTEIGSVQSSGGFVVQFSYGGDGLDASKLLQLPDGELFPIDVMALARFHNESYGWVRSTRNYIEEKNEKERKEAEKREAERARKEAEEKEILGEYYVFDDTISEEELAQDGIEIPVFNGEEVDAILRVRSTESDSDEIDLFELNSNSESDEEEEEPKKRNKRVNERIREIEDTREDESDGQEDLGETSGVVIVEERSDVEEILDDDEIPMEDIE